MLYLPFFAILLMLLAVFHKRQKKKRKASRARFSLETLLFKRERRTNRFEVAKSFLSLRKCDFWGSLRRFQTGELEDLSLSGFRCRVFYPFIKGDRVLAEIEIPAFKNPLRMQGQVCWSRETLDGDFIVGVSFNCLDDYTWKHLQALKKYEILRDAGYTLMQRLEIQKRPEDF